MPQNTSLLIKQPELPPATTICHRHKHSSGIRCDDFWRREAEQTSRPWSEFCWRFRRPHPPVTPFLLIIVIKKQQLKEQLFANKSKKCGGQTCRPPPLTDLSPFLFHDKKERGLKTKRPTAKNNWFCGKSVYYTLPLVGKKTSGILFYHHHAVESFDRKYEDQFLQLMWRKKNNKFQNVSKFWREVLTKSCGHQAILLKNLPSNKNHFHHTLKNCKHLFTSSKQKSTKMYQIEIRLIFFFSWIRLLFVFFFIVVVTKCWRKLQNWEIHLNRCKKLSKTNAWWLTTGYKHWKFTFSGKFAQFFARILTRTKNFERLALLGFERSGIIIGII